MLKAIMTQGSDKASSTNWRSWIVIFISVVVLIFSWNTAMLCPHMDYDWSGWNASDLRPLAEMDAWPADPANKLVYARLHSVTDASGPESLAFDSNGGGPYTGVSDGRILFWNQGGWETFGVTSSVRQVWLYPFCIYQCSIYAVSTCNPLRIISNLASTVFAVFFFQRNS
jgi:PAS domain-containing protein